MRTRLFPLVALVAVGCAPLTQTAFSPDAVSTTELDSASLKPGLFGIDSVDPGSAGAVMAQIHAKRIRVEIKSDLSDAALDAMLASMPAGTRANIQFDYSTLNPSQHGAFTASATNPAKWNAYVDAFEKEAVRRAKLISAKHADKVGTYQIWNEQDFSGGAGGYQPYLAPAAFAQVLTKTCSALKQATPGVGVITGGFMSPRAERWPYVTSVVSAAGASWSCVDGVGYHAYGMLDFSSKKASAFECTSVTAAYHGFTCNKADVAGDIAGLVQRTQKPIFMDEWGLDSNVATDAQRDEVVAKNITAFLDTVSAISDVHEASYYSWGDAGHPALKLSAMPKSQAAFRAAAP